jgi:hypothetical protein
MDYKLEARFTTESLASAEEMQLLKEKVAVVIGDHFHTREVTVWADFTDPKIIEFLEGPTDPSAPGHRQGPPAPGEDGPDG